MSTIKVDTLQSRAGGAVTFTTLPIGASAAGSNAFCAMSNGGSWQTPASGDLILFDDVSTHDCFDTDSCYNTSTYKYTAPATGVYMFWFGIYAMNTDTSNGFGFLKNSSRVRMQVSSTAYFSFSEEDNDGLSEHIQTGMVILPLTSADTMAVIASQQSDYYRGHSQWGGCRLA